MSQNPTCLPVPDIPPDQIESKAASGITQVLKALGVESCKTAQLGAVSLLPPAFIGGTSSVGCEQIAVMANAVETHMQQTACVINKQNITGTTVLNANNKVTLIIGRGSEVCNINIRQDITGDVKASNSFSTQAKTDISNIMKDMVSQIGKVVQDEKIGYLGVPPSQKSIQDFTSYLSQNSTASSINDWTQAALTKIQATNTVEIRVDPYVTIGYLNSVCTGGITIDQNVLASLQAQNVVDSVLTNIFSSNEGAAYKSELSAALKGESSGADSLISAFSGIFVFVIIAIIGGIIIFGKGIIQSAMRYIIPILIAIAIGLAIYFWYKKQYVYMGIAIAGAVGLLGLYIYYLFFRPRNPTNQRPQSRRPLRTFQEPPSQPRRTRTPEPLPSGRQRSRRNLSSAGDVELSPLNRLSTINESSQETPLSLSE